MSDEEQERFAEELDQYIEQLRLQRPTHPPANLTPELTPIYATAKRLHAASPPIADPSPEFKGQLFQRLLAQMRAEEEETMPSASDAESREIPENQPSRSSSDAASPGQRTQREQAPSLEAQLPSATQAQGKRQLRSIYQHTPVPQLTPPAASHPENLDGKKRTRRGLSRRTLFTTGTIAASLAGAAIGAGIEHALESSTQPTANSILPLREKGGIKLPRWISSDKVLSVSVPIPLPDM
jgi:hypothetical protein